MAKSKGIVKMPAGIRNKLMAATSMLLVSCIMMVSSTYAWFTLSTAPEVKNITTTVAGNGSLEIALMPASGLLADITTGTSSESGTTGAVLTANRSWGNIIDLSDLSYGLTQVDLNPAILNYTEDAKLNETAPLAIAMHGFDGRIDTIEGNTKVKSMINLDNSDAGALRGTGYGVRIIGESDKDILESSYGYIVDLAFRLNTGDGNGQAGNLLLQTEAKNRIYDGSTEDTTMGGGSYMSFNTDTGIDLASLANSVRVTFVKNYGVKDDTNSVDVEILGTAKLDYANAKSDAVTSTLKVPLQLYRSTTTSGENGTSVVTDTVLTGEQAVILNGLLKNQSVQVSAIVWLDGEAVTNASVLAAETENVFSKATLNLQFSTNVVLNPAGNNALMGTTTTNTVVDGSQTATGDNTSTAGGSTPTTGDNTSGNTDNAGTTDTSTQSE